MPNPCPRPLHALRLRRLPGLARRSLLLGLATLLATSGLSARQPVPANASEGSDGSIATLRVEDQGSRWLVWADNRLAGPAEVLVDFVEARNVTSSPALPARATLSAHGSGVVAVIQRSDASREPRFRLKMRGIPGEPGTQPGNVLYTLPLDTGSARIDQGYGGSFSHQDDENRYALDLAVPEGTPVLAARDGVVMQVEASHRGRAGAEGGASGNFIRLLHRDGTMTIYAHLQPGGVLVTPGRQVRAGERIGRSGSTGLTTGPHLHFAVQTNRGMRLVSLPFRMLGLPGADGPVTQEGVRTRSGP